MKISFRTVSRSSVLCLALLAAATCQTGCLGTLVSGAVSGSTELYKDHFGSRSFVKKANLFGGRVEEVIERTAKADMLRGRFTDVPPCVQVIYRVPVEGSSAPVRGEVLLPCADWNGTVRVLGCEGPGGGFNLSAPQFLKEGAAVVSCDGGMNFVRTRDGSADPVGAGAQRSAAREVFLQSALHAATAAGKELVAAYYGKPVEKTVFSGRETGAAQGLFLAERFPEDVDALELVNPAIDFWSALAYNVNVSSRIREASGRVILRDRQCAAVVSAAKELAADQKIDEAEFFERAAKFEPSFTFGHTRERVCRMWHEILSAETISSNLAVRVATPELGSDLTPFIRAKPWRVQWIFGVNELGHGVTPEKLLAARDACAALTPSCDLSAFAARGGTCAITIEKNNVFVPPSLAEQDLGKIKGLKPTVKKQ